MSAIDECVIDFARTVAVLVINVRCYVYFTIYEHEHLLSVVVRRLLVKYHDTTRCFQKLASFY
jgi:hypothetical protein